MRKRKHRLCTSLLCSVLILSNALSVGTPVYAKSLETDSSIVAAASDEAMPSASDDGSGSVPAGSSEGDPGSGSADAAPGAGDNTQTPADPGTEDTGKTEDPADTGNTDQTGDPSTPDNPADTDDPGKTEDPGTSDNPADPDDSDKTEDPGTSDNPADADDPDKTEDPGASDNPADTENPGNSEEEPGADDPTGSGDEASVSDNDISEEELSEEGNLYTDQAADTSEYLTEDPQRYQLKDIEMTPGSYSADFSAVSGKYLNDYYFQIVYTDDATLAENFFKGSTKVEQDAITSSGFTLASFTDLNSESISNNQYNVSARFTGSGVLSPETTYYYRLVYYAYDSTKNSYFCSFLTEPMQFTTKPALETSSVKISDISIEAAGYQRAKIVWTVENPDSEALFDIKLSCTDGTEGGSTYTAMKYEEYKNEQYVTVPNKYYVTVSSENSTALKDATAQLTTYIGNGQKNIVKSATIPLTLQSVDDAKIELTEKVRAGSFLASLKLAPYYSIDGYVNFTLYYRQSVEQSADTSWDSFQTGSVNNDQENAESATGTIKLENLVGMADYEYYIEPQGALAAKDFSDILGSETNPLTFTTKEGKTYTKDDFPDEVFFNYIKSQTSATGEGVTSFQLEQLTNLSYPRSSASGNISSLQGIEYIENLTHINLEGHTITNVGGLSSLTELTNIDLDYNDLTQLPDLSGMGQLRYASFNGNKISADSVAADRVPASLLANNTNWIPNTIQSQRSADIAVTFAPEYYKAGDTQPFLVKIEGLKKDYSRKYTLSLTIDGKTVSSDPGSYDYYDMYYIKDILKDSSGTETGITVTEGTSYPVAITLTDSYGNPWLDGKTETATATVSFAGSSAPVVNTQYIKPNVSYTNIRINNLPAAYTEENIAGISLADQDGKEVGNASKENIYVGTSYYNPYEDIFGDISISNITDNSNVSLSANIYFAKYLTAGDYKAIVSLTDPQSSSTFEKAVCVDDIAMIESLYTTSGYSDNAYDNYGDYLYLYLEGANIDPAKVYPVLYENGQAVTEFVNGSIGRYGETYVYKLRKLDKETYWNFSGSKTFSFDFTAVKDYRYISTIKDSNKRITLYLPSGDFVTFEHYNYKKGVYEVKTDSTVANGTKVSVSVYNSNSNGKTLMGTAEGTITDSFLSLTFLNAEGTRYEPPKDKAAYFHYTYTDQDGERQKFDHTNHSVEWYNYYDSGTSSKNSYTNMVLYQKVGLKELSMDVSIPEKKIRDTSAVTAQITDGNGTSIGNSPTLSKGSGTSGYAKYTGTWSSDTGLGEGIYTVRFLLDGNSVYTTKLYVYDDAKFYMNSQWMGTWSNSSGKGVYVSFSSEQLMGNYIHDYSSKVSAAQALAYWNNGNFKLELFDRLGNSVTGWKPDHASWNGSNFYLYLKDVPDGYVGFYAKVSRANSLGIRLNNNSIYYATAYNANEQYGEWDTFGGSNVWFNDTADLNAYYCFGSYAYPVTVTITRPYDTTPVNTFTASQATNGNFYYFTASDLKGTDPNEAYRISAVSVDGSSRSEIGYLGVRGGQSTVVHVSGVTLNKSTLNLQLGQSEKLAATVKPENATNKNVAWSSENTDVATVDAQGNVTAVAVGTTKITVTTADNNKTAICTVNVFNYTLDQSTLAFDLATEEDSKPIQLHVKNGDKTITSNITWSSSDDSVATVANGMVTPVDAGTAQILAAVKNGPTLSCTVTVSNNKLTAAALSESSCELYVDTQGNAVTDEDDKPIPQKPKTKSIRLYYSPSTANLESVEWTSSDETVVSVDSDPNNPNETKAVITAKSKGTATITATVTTASGTKKCTCTVTVKAVISAADAEKTRPPKGDLIALTNEQLKLGDVSLDKFPGWKWLEEEKSVTLAQFAGMQQKSFAATYTDPDNPDAEPYETAIPVTLSTVTGIGIQTESSTVQRDSNAELFINWIMSGTQPDDMSEHVKKVVWSSDKPAVADVAKDADGKATLTARAAGKATVKAQITFKNNKTYKAQYKITVVEGEPAVIQVSDVSGFTKDPSVPETYRSKLGSNAADNNRTIHATVTGADKLTAKSNNANVAAVGKITSEGSTYTIPLTLKAAGMAKITLTANDTAKTQKDIFLYVTDSKPIVSEDPVTVNLQQTDGTAFMIYSGDGYQVTTAVLSGVNADKFNLTTPDAAETPDGYLLKANDGTGTGSYKLSLNVQVKSLADPDAAVETFDNVALNVKVIDQQPKYKIKQSTKFNLFYKDWESRLEITTDEVLDSAELTDCDFTLIRNENSDYTITAKQPESLTSNCDKAGTLTLTFAGYNPVYTSFTVSTEYKKPKITLAAKSATLYPNAGINRALIRLKDGKEDYLPTAMPVIDGTATNLFNLTKDGDSLLLTARSSELPGSTNVAISLQEANWAEAIRLTYTVKTSKGKPSVKLGKATLQLNTNPSAASYDMAATEIMWKDGAAFDASRVSVSAADNKAKALLNKEITFRFDETKNQIIAKLNKTDPDAVIQTGSYKFKVNAIKETGETTLTASAPLTVKIVNVAVASGQKSKAIAISSKGSIDILNREGTSVTVTAALKSLNGTVTGARLSGSAAHLFEIDTEAPIKDNKVVIRAKSGVSLITKYAYKVKLNLTIENAEGDEFYYLTPDISLKLKQGKPKVTVAPKTATFFSGSYNNTITRKLTVSLKGAEAPAVERVELVNDFDGAFDIDNINYDEQNGTFTLSSTEKALKGKSYNLQLKVTFKDQADNEKPTVVKYSVKIK